MKSIGIFLAVIFIFGFVAFKMDKLTYGWIPVTITRPNGDKIEAKMYDIGWIVK